MKNRVTFFLVLLLIFSQVFSSNLSQVFLSNYTLAPSIVEASNSSFAPLVDSLGWQKVSETWTYASSTTITVPTGAASRFQKGDKIRLINNFGPKYFYIRDIADTLLTVTGGSDYSLTNNAISSIYLSRAENPFGFPDWFNWTPVFTGFSVDPTNNVAKFSIKGKVCHVYMFMGTNGTSNATTFTVSAPVPGVNDSVNHYQIAAMPLAVNNTAGILDSQVRIDPTAPTVFTLVANAGWTASGGKRAGFVLTYEWE